MLANTKEEGCMMLFSIVVPVYKVERYLPECVESILQQGFSDFEAILVDDGSPDRCPQICDDYALRDKRIKVIHKQNGGLSDARNAGLKVSKGRYILFLDSDDYLTPHCLEHAYDILMATQWPDIVMGTFVSVFTDNDKGLHEFSFEPSFGAINDTVRIMSELLTQTGEIPWSACRNIYKAELIAKNGLVFEKGLVGAEDCAFFMDFMRLAKSYTTMTYPLVNYRVSREGSITNAIKYDAILGQLEVFGRCYYHYIQDDRSQDVRAIAEHFAKKYANTVSSFHWLTNVDEIREVEQRVRCNREILRHARGLKYDIAKLFWSILGYHRGTKAIRVLRK